MAKESNPGKMVVGYRGIEPPSRPPALDPADAPPREAARTALVDLPGYERMTPIHTGIANVLYKALDSKLGRWVAIDMLPPLNRQDAASILRFRAEAATLAKLKHPNLSQILEIGEHEGSPFLVQEYVEGGSLSLYAKAVRLSKKEVAALMEPVARAVQVMHDHGILHRDLKPNNVLVTADGIPKIADFGLSVHLTSNSAVDRDGKILGNPAYMAPERAHPRLPLSVAVDIYSLGAILFEILTGRPPIVGDSPMDTAMKAKTLEVQSPRLVDPTVPLDLEAICMKCLRRDPRERYASAAAFGDDLKRFISGEPIQARPIGSIERTLKWSKRKPLFAALTTLLVGGLLYGGYVAWDKYEHAIHRQRTANAALEAVLNDPSIADRVKSDPNLKAVRERPEVNDLLKTPAINNSQTSKAR